MPGINWVARDTTYDAMGHVSAVSEWYDESVAGTPALTQYLGYDAFGRPGTIRPPDGSDHDVTMSYTGDRVVKRTVKIATSRTAEESVTSTGALPAIGRSRRPPGGLRGVPLDGDTRPLLRTIRLTYWKYGT